MAWIFQTDGNYVNFNGGGNLWRLHKDSSCITWHWDESGDLFFDVYDQAYNVKSANIGDVVIDGVPLSTASDFPTAIRAVFTGLSSGSSGSSYLIETIILNNAQIKAVPTPSNVIDAPGANKVINVISITALLHLVDFYTNVTGDFFSFDVGSTSFFTLDGANPFQEAAGDWFIKGVPNNSPSIYSDQIVNQPLVMSFTNTGDLTGGNDLNTLKIIIEYTINDFS